jgi:hypothetical protein
MACTFVPLWVDESNFLTGSRIDTGRLGGEFLICAALIDSAALSNSYKKPRMYRTLPFHVGFDVIQKDALFGGAVSCEIQRDRLHSRPGFAVRSSVQRRGWQREEKGEIPQDGYANPAGFVQAATDSRGSYQEASRETYEVAAMPDKAGVDQKASDAELIALLRKLQGAIEAQGELNELNLLLQDFARELLKKRLLLRVEFVQIMELSRPG